jgi:hypothetical protein
MKSRWIRKALLGGILALGGCATASAQDPSCGMGGYPGPMGMPCDPSAYCDPGHGGLFNGCWIRAEYLLWWVRGADTPPLLTTGPLNIVGPSGIPGVLGQPTTQILLGGTSHEFNPSSGGRVTIGAWLDCQQCFGMEVSGLTLDEQSLSNTFSAAGTPNTIPISIPFFNLLAGQEDSTGVALPGDFSGTATLSLTTRAHAAELNCIGNIISKPAFRMHVIGGYRFFRLDEDLQFTTLSQFVPPLSPDIFFTDDRFESKNTFHGGQIGARLECQIRGVSLELTGKCALGRMERETTIDGLLLTDDFGALQAFPGGYLALPTNIGTYRDNRFAIVPEVTAQIGFQITNGIRVFGGYNLLYATHVARPGDQIDRAINITQGPAFTNDPDNTLLGPAAPLFRNRDTSWWAQGANFGVEMRF